MSGFISKLKNKVSYKINQAVDDPAANEFAKNEQSEQEKNAVSSSPKSLEQLRMEKMNELRKEDGFTKKMDDKMQELFSALQKKYKGEGKSEKESQELSVKYYTDKIIPLLNEKLDENKPGKALADLLFTVIQDQVDQFTDTEDPDTISPTRILKKAWRFMEWLASILLVPILAIIVSMYVANEMIVHPAPIRAGFFILTFIASIFFQPALILLCGYYLAKSGYSYYVNEMTAREKQRIMPTIFSILPLTTYQPEGLLESFFYYPFTYPKSKQDKEELPKIMEEYQAKLEESFPYLQKIKSLSFVTQGLELIKDNMEKMHKPKADNEPKAENLNGEKKMNTLPPALTLTNEQRAAFNKIGRNNQSTTVPQTNQNKNKTSSPSQTNQNKNIIPIPSPVIPVEEKTEEKQEEKPEESSLPPVIPVEEKTEEKIEEKQEEKPEESSLPPVIPVEEKIEEKSQEKVEESPLPPVIPVEEKIEEKSQEKVEESPLPPTIEEKPEEKQEETPEESKKST